MTEKQPLLTDKTLHYTVKKKDERRYFWQYDFAPCMPARYVLVVISCLGFINVYALRGNLSMAIVAMTNSTTNSSSHLVKTRIELACCMHAWVSFCMLLFNFLLACSVV